VKREVPALAPGTRGLRRDPALVPLSREHHGVLVRALDLKQAARRDGAAQRAAAQAFLDAFEAEMRGHFADEEELLLPAARSFDPEGVARIAAEHREMEALADSLRSGLDQGRDLGTSCAELGQLLDDHVRYEERAFFETLQRHLSAAELAELGRRLDARRGERGAPSCPVPPRPPAR
jgi:hemerythrin